MPQKGARAGSPRTLPSPLSGSASTVPVLFPFCRPVEQQIKDDPEATQGQEVCHLDRIVLMQTWLSLASDRPGDACLKQCGSVDDFCCYRQQQLRSSKPPTKKGGGGGGGGGGGDAVRGGERRGRGAAASRGDGGGEGRGSRPVRQHNIKYPISPPSSASQVS